MMSCLGRKKAYNLVTDHDKPLDKNYGYDLIYEKDKYVSVPSNSVKEFPMITIDLKWCHYEKFNYWCYQITDKYKEKIKYTPAFGWFGMHQYELWDGDIMKDVVKDLLIILNCRYLICKGCDKTFDYLVKWIDHKKSCSLLLKRSEMEEIIVRYMKFESRAQRNTFGIIDKQKEIIYLCTNGEFSIVPIPCKWINNVVLFSVCREYYQFDINQYVIQTRQKQHGYKLLEIMGVDVNVKQAISTESKGSLKGVPTLTESKDSLKGETKVPTLTESKDSLKGESTVPTYTVFYHEAEDSSNLIMNFFSRYVEEHQNSLLK